MPDSVDAQSDLSGTYNKLGKYAEAADTYKQVIRLKPDDAEAHNNMGYALGKTSAGLTRLWLFKRAIELKPDYARRIANLGWAYNNVGNFVGPSIAQKGNPAKTDLPKVISILGSPTAG